MTSVVHADSPPLAAGLWTRLVPPLGDRELGPFYRQLATMLDAGVPLVRSLEAAGRGVSNRSAAAILHHLRTGAAAGSPIHEQMARFPHVFRSLDVQMIRAGEESGNLPAVLGELARSCEARVRERRMLRGDLIRPVLTLHALFLLAPVPELFLGTIGWWGYLVRGLGPLAPLYALVIGGGIGLRMGSISAPLRRAGFACVHRLPVLGGAVRKLGIARLATALSALYEAGIGIEQALPLAGRASGNDVLEAAARESAAGVRRGLTLGEALRETGAFPARTLMMVETGEESGQLDTVLDKIAETHAEEGRHTIRTLSRLFSLGVYLLVALLVAVRVITFYTGYFTQIGAHL